MLLIQTLQIFNGRNSVHKEWISKSDVLGNLLTLLKRNLKTIFNSSRSA